MAGAAHGLGPGVPDTPAIMKVIPKLSSRHRRGESYAVRAASVLAGCTTNIRWRLPACDSVIADYRSNRALIDEEVETFAGIEYCPERA